MTLWTSPASLPAAFDGVTFTRSKPPSVGSLAGLSSGGLNVCRAEAKPWRRIGNANIKDLKLKLTILEDLRVRHPNSKQSTFSYVCICQFHFDHEKHLTPPLTGRAALARLLRQQKA